MANKRPLNSHKSITSKTDCRLLDSAMGTRLAALGLDFKTDDPCFWNLTRPDDVLRCHAADLAAGADFLTANTFGANRNWLEKYGRTNEIGEINRLAVALARQALNGQSEGFVIGCVGPTALESKKVFIEQAHLLRHSGADLLHLETLTAPQAMTASAWLDEVRLPVWMSLWNWGDDPVKVATTMKNAGVARWGVNCDSDKKLIQSVFQTLFDHQLQATLLKPSALEMNEFIGLARHCRKLGASHFGGCCGTDETFITALKDDLIINSTN